MTPPTPRPGPIHLGSDGLRHLLRHCRSQNPAERQYRDDFIRVFGEPRILPFGNPTSPTFPLTSAAGPFISFALQLVAEAVARGRYVVYDEFDHADAVRHTGAAVLTRPGWECVLRRRAGRWEVVTGYFKHTTDVEVKAFRTAARRLVSFYTNGTFRVPPPDLKVRTHGLYRTNIRFGSLAEWGETGGQFDLNRLPPW